MKRRKIRLSVLFPFILILVVIAMAIFPQIFTSKDPLEIDPANKLLGPSLNNILGTDEYGRDIWTRIAYGAAATMEVGIGSALLAVLIGVPLGLIAGYFQGIADSLIMRFLDAFLAFPMFLLAILVMTIFNANAFTLIITIGIVNFPRFARIVRGNVLSLRSREFVEANRAFGAKTPYILFRTILPNCISSIIVQGSLLVAVAIIIEAGMSYLGLGIKPPAPAWGSMLFYAQSYMYKVPLYAIAPGVIIFLVVMSINFMGDALRDWFDPVKKH